MHKIVDEWDKERAIKKSEEAFNSAFEDIFDDDSDFESDSDSGSDSGSDSDSDSASWETFSQVSRVSDAKLILTDTGKDYYSEYILGEIVMLQKEYQKAEELGLDFEWYHQNSWFFDIEPSKTVILYDDVFPHVKNMFVSNHKSYVKNKRVGKRMSDTGFMA
jgi:hypothetical protein